MISRIGIVIGIGIDKIQTIPKFVMYCACVYIPGVPAEITIISINVTLKVMMQKSYVPPIRERPFSSVISQVIYIRRKYVLVLKFLCTFQT